MDKFSRYIALVYLLLISFILHNIEVSCSSPVSPAQQILNAKCNLTVVGTTLASVSFEERFNIVKQVRSSTVCSTSLTDCLQDNFMMSQGRNPAKDIIYALWAPFDSVCLNGFRACSGGTLKMTDCAVIMVTAAKDQKKFRNDYIRMFQKAPENCLGKVQDAAAVHYVSFITTNGRTKIDCSNPAAIAKQLEADIPKMNTSEGRKNLENLYFSLDYACINNVDNAYLSTHKKSVYMLNDFSTVLPTNYYNVYYNIETALLLENPAGMSFYFVGKVHSGLLVNAYAHYSCLMRFYERTLCYVANCAYYQGTHETLWQDVQYSRGDDAFKKTVQAYIVHSCNGGKPDCSKPPK